MTNSFTCVTHEGSPVEKYRAPCAWGSKGPRETDARGEKGESMEDWGRASRTIGRQHTSAVACREAAPLCSESSGPTRLVTAHMCHRAHNSFG